MFRDRKICGWNLVSRWEYSICLRWVAKSWFRVYIYTKSLILWTYKLWKYISELFYLLDPCIYIIIYIYMVFCIFNGIFYSMKNEYQQNQQLHINIFIKEGIITGIIGLLEYSICWFHVYIYRFSAPSMNYWLLYPTKNELLTFQLVNLGDLVELHILSMKPHKNCFIKKWISLEYSICWFHVYIYIGFLHPPWITDYCIQQRMNF